MTAATQCPRCKGAGVIILTPLEILCQRKGLKQKDAAAALGVDQSALSRMFAGLAIPWKHREKWAAFFGVTSGQLVGHDPLPAPKAARPIKAPPAGAVAASRAHRGRVAATRGRQEKTQT